MSEPTLKDLVEEFCREVDRTAQWREAKGMRPATDTSDFSSVPPSTLGNLKRWVRDFREAMERPT